MPSLAEHALLIIRERYADFSPTLACEKLAEVHGLYLAKETVCSGQEKMATALEFFQNNRSDSFGVKPRAYQ